MKNEKVVTIPVKDLEINGVYYTHTKDLIKIIGIDEKHRERGLHLYNMTLSCNMYVDLDRHTIVERVR